MGRRRANPYELAQLSICRKGLALGLTDCQQPDQFFQCIASYQEWMSPTIVNVTAPGTFMNAGTPHSGKSITVRGIQFDYQYACSPDTVGVEDEAAGVISIRSALVVLRVAGQGSGGEDDPITPLSPPTNLLFRNETSRLNVQNDATAFVSTGGRYRMLWRGMELMGMQLSSNAAISANFVTPRLLTQSRHVRVRTAARLQRDEALFFVSEVVNPFLTANPTLGLDLFGSLVVKTNWSGPVRYDQTL